MATPRRVSGPLTPQGQQNQAPLQAYARNRTVEQRNQLALSNLPLVKQLARRESQRSPVPIEDLVQIGCVGLIKALEAYDPGRRTALSSFAVPYVRGTMRQLQRDQLPPLHVSRGLRELHGKGQRLQLERQQRGLPTLPEADLIQHLGVTRGRWQEACMAARALQVASLDQPRPGLEADSEGPAAQGGLAERVADPGGRDPLDWACELECQQQLDQLVAQLPAQERTLLLGRVLAKRSFQELGQAIGVSAKEARRRHDALLARLRTQLDRSLLA